MTSEADKRRSNTYLLAIVAVAVVVIAVVLVYRTFFTGSDGPKSDAERVAAEAKFRDGAELYCTLGGVVPGMTSIYDEAYLNCVDEETASDLEQWENEGRPDPATIT